jgi:serine/threonine protein kinase
VDVYSAGVVLYAMLTARLPFLADNDETLLSQIRCGLFQIPPHVSEEAAALIRTMMSPCPSARYGYPLVTTRQNTVPRTAQLQTV